MLRHIAVIAGGLLILAFLYTGVIPNLEQSPQPVACTLDAKICPDGSAVGRTAPSCEFAPCPVIPVDYVCASEKYFTATFTDDIVTLALSDGRTLILSIAEAASGAKYTTGAGEIVFWTKDYSAFVTESNVETYSACRVRDLTFPEL
ncbi:MAG: MliC family protein [Candidatus Pacebacteria bacterium]|nr:MliC family protein [Candidatus Paceibacterota bacterium]